MTPGGPGDIDDDDNGDDDNMPPIIVQKWERLRKKSSSKEIGEYGDLLNHNKRNVSGDQ